MVGALLRILHSTAGYLLMVKIIIYKHSLVRFIVKHENILNGIDTRVPRANRQDDGRLRLRTLAAVVPMMNSRLRNSLTKPPVKQAFKPSLMIALLTSESRCPPGETW